MDLSEAIQTIGGSRPTLFRRALLLAGSFDPIAEHHMKIVHALLELKHTLEAQEPDVPVTVHVWPVAGYPGKKQQASAADRKVMLERSLAGLDVVLNLHDLNSENVLYTSTLEMQKQLACHTDTVLGDEYFAALQKPAILTEVWHVIGADNASAVKNWESGHLLWRQARFIVLMRPGYTPEEFPPKSIPLELNLAGSCTDIRALIKQGGDWEGFVPPAAAHVIKEHGLYGYQRDTVA